VLLAGSDTLDIADFQRNLTAGTSVQAQKNLPEVGSITLEEMEYQMITRAMQYHQNKVSKVARSLGITRFALYRRLEKYGISFDSEEV
jgi:DNA-binding NtrC family response regulator